MQNSNSFLTVYLAPRVCRGPLQSVGELGLGRLWDPRLVELYYVFAIWMCGARVAGAQDTLAQWWVSLVASESVSGIERWERQCRGMWAAATPLEQVPEVWWLEEWAASVTRRRDKGKEMRQETQIKVLWIKAVTVCLGRSKEQFGWGPLLLGST